MMIRKSVVINVISIIAERDEISYKESTAIVYDAVKACIGIATLGVCYHDDVLDLWQHLTGLEPDYFLDMIA